MSGVQTAVARPADFWAVTAYFNLAGSVARRADYRCFRQSLAAPLVTVEWHPEGCFELGPGDADLLLQVAGGDPMWQKERLLGIALAALPDAAEYVAWLDCDGVFADPDWIAETRRLLETHALVQPFAEVAYLGAEQTAAFRAGRWSTADALGAARVSRPAFARVVDRVGIDRIVGVDLEQRFATSATAGGDYDVRARPAYGHAWATRREIARRIGLYERCVMGAGDLLFAYGALGHADALIANHRSVGWGWYGDCASYRDWSASAFRATAGRCAAAPGTLLHLHHGRLEDRQYRSRLDGLVPFALDLDRDLVGAAGQPWSWKRERAALSRYFLDYLERRREDQ